MTNETTMLSDDDVAEFALRLRTEPPGNWSSELVRSWGLRPAGDHQYLAVPVGLADASVGGQIDRFRQVAGEVCAVLGPATIRGAGSDHHAFGPAAPAWGGPYLRWRRPYPGDTVELRAGVHGPVLMLQPTGHAERHLISLSWEEAPIGGSLCELSDDVRAAHGHSLAGYEVPDETLVDDWLSFERALGRWLTTMSAEGAALELSFGPVVADTAGLGFHFDVLPGRNRLVIGAFVPGAVDAPALGWLSPDAVADDPYGLGGPEWRLLGGPAGAVDGDHLARVVVATARACGLTGPWLLKIIDGMSGRLRDGTNYRHTYFGLGLDHDR
ncbi:hypothetical protein ACQP2T_51030 [Nonomuraea sp. CA-143628]|uniref:hypothetical protein n=1 Tax=Nonomuraea sp. CA-143628 TaxID=3239997 RepID=UPI003D925EEE